MKNSNSLNLFRFLPILILLIVISACSTIFDGGDFTFTSPPGYKIKTYESYADSFRNSEFFLFAQNDHVYFQIFRQKIPQGSDMQLLLDNYISKVSEESSNYQFISQNTINFADRDAIECVYRKFHGEPYVQNWEIWIEQDGFAYTLSCTEPVVSTIGEILPIAEDCIELAEGFQFK